MSDKKCNITPDSTWQEMTEGGVIYNGANSEDVKTGAWRSKKPKYIVEKCKQCALCVPCCPDNAIPIDENGNRKDFNFDYCKGCGVCIKACPFGAIEWEEDNK